MITSQWLNSPTTIQFLLQQNFLPFSKTMILIRDTRSLLVQMATLILLRQNNFNRNWKTSNNLLKPRSATLREFQQKMQIYIGSPHLFLNLEIKFGFFEKNISAIRSSNNIDYKQLGPFKIVQKISLHAFKLKLPQSIWIHSIYHVSPLGTHSRRSVTRSKKIIRHHRYWAMANWNTWSKKYWMQNLVGQTLFLVKYLHDPIPSWESYDNVKDLGALDKFFAQYSQRNYIGS